MTIGQSTAGAAALTTSASAFTASVPGAGQTFTVASAAGYPSSGAFTVQLDRGLASEEKILCSGRSGTTFTVQTRGYDGTTAQSHTNPTVNLRVPATVYNALIEHVDDIEAVPHATKLPVGTVAGHDTTTRHVLGTGIPVSATLPTTITPDDSGSVGAANAVARSDHRHAITTATAVSVGTANSEGSASTFARSDHVHELGAGAIDAAALFAAGVVDAAALGALSVETAKINNLAVTSGKLGADSVIAGKIADGAVDVSASLVDGIVTLAKMASEASTDFTGTVDFCSGTFVLGTGGTQFAKVYKLGRIVFGWCGFVLGTGGNIVGNFELTLPYTSANNGARGFAAARARHDPDVPVAGVGTIVANTNLAVSFGTFGGASVWNATFPFNWDVNDSVECVFFYEAAT